MLIQDLNEYLYKIITNLNSNINLKFISLNNLRFSLFFIFFCNFFKLFRIIHKIIKIKIIN